MPLYQSNKKANQYYSMCQDLQMHLKIGQNEFIYAVSSFTAFVLYLFFYYYFWNFEFPHTLRNVDWEKLHNCVHKHDNYICYQESKANFADLSKPSIQGLNYITCCLWGYIICLENSFQSFFQWVQMWTHFNLWFIACSN